MIRHSSTTRIWQKTPLIDNVMKSYFPSNYIFCWPSLPPPKKRGNRQRHNTIHLDLLAAMVQLATTSLNVL